MIKRTLRALFAILLGACLLRADYPYNYIGAPDVNYSLARLPRPPAPLAPTDKDGICVVWYKHWAPSNAVNPQDALTDTNFSNPFNNGRAWIDIKIKFFIERVVTDDANLDADGFLRDPEAMIAQGVIGPTVKVEFEAIQYRHGNGVVKPYFGNGIVVNYKLVSINGKKHWSEAPTGPIGAWDYGLPNMEWKKIEFNIPVKMIKFPRRGALGSKPVPAENHLEVTTDFNDYTYASPGTRVAWSKSTVKAIAPILLVHGMAVQGNDWANPATLNNGQPWCPIPGWANLIDYFRNYLGIWSNNINLGGSLRGFAGIDSDAKDLAEQIPKILSSIEAKTCHVVAHSKGGLDMRAFLDSSIYINEIKPKMEVLSLYTIASPHRGSVAADIANYSSRAFSLDPDIQTTIQYTPWYVLWPAPLFGATRDLQTSSMDLFNANHSNINVNKFYNFAADADLNGNGQIEDVEAWGAVESIPQQALLGTAIYRVLRNVKKITYNLGPRSIYGRVYISVAQRQLQPQPNDLRVTKESAIWDSSRMILPLQGGNHGTIKSKTIIESIINQVQNDFPITQ